MAVDRNFAKAQIARLAGIPAPPPQTAEALADLVDALEDASRSEHHCKRIVTAIVESPGEPPRWPTIASIRAIAWELLTDAEKANMCRACDGSGYVYRSRMVAMGGRLVSYDASEPCASCRPKPQEAAS